MAQQLRIEEPNRVSLITTRTRNSELWFVNNPALEYKSLGYLAKYQERYSAPIYAAVFQGNHYHLVAEFPLLNRASFMRDFNSILARLCTRNVPAYPGGRLWGRRYAEQALPTNPDIEEYFFYCALQPVNAGLCEHPSDYPGYNSFYDAISGREREYKVIDWAAYNDRLRFDPKAKLKDFTRKYKLKFSRLPGYEHLSQSEYKKLMLIKLEEHRQQAIAKRRAEGSSFLGRKALRRTEPGATPTRTKKSTRYSYYPLVLTKCRATKKRFLSWYFAIRDSYIRASKQFRAGHLTVHFPSGTYRPPSFAPTG